jgi:hypothetical protein
MGSHSFYSKFVSLQLGTRCSFTTSTMSSTSSTGSELTSSTSSTSESTSSTKSSTSTTCSQSPSSTTSSTSSSSSTSRACTPAARPFKLIHDELNHVKFEHKHHQHFKSLDEQQIDKSTCRTSLSQCAIGKSRMCAQRILFISRPSIFI